MINIRTRRTNQVEDLFDAAIAATAVADASQNYLSGIGPPNNLPDKDYQAMMNDIIRNGIENHVKRATEAREAIARVVQYEPRVRAYYQDSVLNGDKPQEIINLLREGRSHALVTGSPMGHTSRKPKGPLTWDS
ncbi:MAG TPA: hypothetical protein VMV92_12340 [Streptosporangiaceae bacterium]|nr:hypothetical protein [Streptosporangiaceae bacterium]